MERIVIPGKATYTPVALTDVMVGAPMAARVLLGATAPGQVVAAASFGYYTGSAARDWWARREVRPIDFQDAFGADVFTLREMPADQRHWEVQLLGRALNEGFVADRPPREEVARRVDQHLTDYIAAITGQQLVTSTAIRSHTIASFLMPGAIGACDAISGDVAIFKDVGLLEPHVIAHEFCHRKGYMKELHAQVLSYLALRTSADPILVQAARLERLHRQLKVIRQTESNQCASDLIGRAQLRPELSKLLRALIADVPDKQTFMSRLYDKRMRLSGQNGLSDYGAGFTNLLCMLATDASRPERAAHAAI